MPRCLNKPLIAMAHGHGLKRTYPVQQSTSIGTLKPHALASYQHRRAIGKRKLIGGAERRPPRCLPDLRRSGHDVLLEPDRHVPLPCIASPFCLPSLILIKRLFNWKVAKGYLAVKAFQLELAPTRDALSPAVRSIPGSEPAHELSGSSCLLHSAMWSGSCRNVPDFDREQ